MNSDDVASIASSVAALVNRAHRLGDKRPTPIISDEILADSGFDEIDCRQETASLKRRASFARRAARAALHVKHLLPPA